MFFVHQTDKWSSESTSSISWLISEVKRRWMAKAKERKKIKVNCEKHGRAFVGKLLPMCRSVAERRTKRHSGMDAMAFYIIMLPIRWFLFSSCWDEETRSERKGERTCIMPSHCEDEFNRSHSRLRPAVLMIRRWQDITKAESNLVLSALPLTNEHRARPSALKLSTVSQLENTRNIHLLHTTVDT